MTIYNRVLAKVMTPQSEPLDESQVRNSAGGYVYQLDGWAQLDRFLILGTEGGTYYASARDITKENTIVLRACLQEDGPRVVRRIVEISTGGRAPRNDPALYALAVCMSEPTDTYTRRLAREALPKVARTASFLFQFLSYVTELRGKGRCLQRAVQDWYLAKDEDFLALQTTKYRQRYGWTHRDALRAFRPKATNEEQNAIFHWAVTGETSAPLPSILEGYLKAQSAPVQELPNIITDYNLTWEHIPTAALGDAKVWAALLPNLPMRALLRNLSKLTSVGVLGPLSEQTRYVCDKFTDAEAIKRARLHPLNILVGMRSYAAGEGRHLMWNPVQAVVDALDEAFYLGFDAVEPIGNNVMIAVDVSGSMGVQLSGYPISAREVAGALAMLTARKEKSSYIVGFQGSLVPLRITSRWRLEEVSRYLRGLTYGSTDCAAPVIYATHEKLAVDSFVVITDNETWAGQMHPSVALSRYRQLLGRDARLAVYGVTSTGFSIADPKDPGMLDLVGFDTAGPTVLRDFLAKDI